MKFLVKNQKIEVLEREVIASDQIAFVSVKFVFDGAWKTLHKVVQFWTIVNKVDRRREKNQKRSSN